jgi:hypothetical protein
MVVNGFTYIFSSYLMVLYKYNIPPMSPATCHWPPSPESRIQNSQSQYEECWLDRPVPGPEPPRPNENNSMGPSSRLDRFRINSPDFGPRSRGRPQFLWPKGRADGNKGEFLRKYFLRIFLRIFPGITSMKLLAMKMCGSCATAS